MLLCNASSPVDPNLSQDFDYHQLYQCFMVISFSSICQSCESIIVAMVDLTTALVHASIPCQAAQPYPHTPAQQFTYPRPGSHCQPMLCQKNKCCCIDLSPLVCQDKLLSQPECLLSHTSYHVGHVKAVDFGADVRACISVTGMHRADFLFGRAAALQRSAAAETALPRNPWETTTNRYGATPH